MLCQIRLLLLKTVRRVFKKVETGARTADMVELVSGVDIGDSIIVSGVLFVRPDGKVKINKVKSVKVKSVKVKNEK